MNWEVLKRSQTRSSTCIDLTLNTRPQTLRTEEINCSPRPRLVTGWHAHRTNPNRFAKALKIVLTLKPKPTK